MRERATLAGGTLAAGPAEGGGFEVRATLPITEPDTPSATTAPNPVLDRTPT